MWQAADVDSLLVLQTSFSLSHLCSEYLQGLENPAEITESGYLVRQLGDRLAGDFGMQITDIPSGAVSLSNLDLPSVRDSLLGGRDWPPDTVECILRLSAAMSPTDAPLILSEGTPAPPSNVILEGSRLVVESCLKQRLWSPEIARTHSRNLPLFLSRIIARKGPRDSAPIFDWTASVLFVGLEGREDLVTVLYFHSPQTHTS